MVYPGKLSPVVQVSICVVVGFMVSSRPRKTLKNLLLWVTGIVLLMLDFLAMMALDNRTGQLAMGLTAACASTFALHQLLERRKSRIWNCRRVTTWAPLALLTVSVALIRYTPTSLLGRNIDPTFTGRKTLWEATWQGILDRPLFGWGWLSGWFDPLFRDTVLPEVGGRAPRFYWSHSVWLDIGLAVGLPGLILVIISMVVALAGPIRVDLRSHVTTSIMLTTLPIHLMFTSLHREAQYAFAVVVLAALIRSGAVSDRSNIEEKLEKAIS